jgi:hypothetical protein
VRKIARRPPSTLAVVFGNPRCGRGFCRLAYGRCTTPRNGEEGMPSWAVRASGSAQTQRYPFVGGITADETRWVVSWCH